MSETQRVEAIFNGNVQGVGFRFTAQKVAFRLGVTGFVKNLPDGDVLTVGEGEKRILESFVNDMKGLMNEYISDVRITWHPATGEFKSFNIRF